MKYEVWVFIPRKAFGCIWIDHYHFASLICYMYIINQLIQHSIILVLESGLAHIYVRHACYARAISLRERQAYNPPSSFGTYIQISNWILNICYLKISIFHPFTMYWLFLQETWATHIFTLCCNFAHCNMVL